MLPPFARGSGRAEFVEFVQGPLQGGAGNGAEAGVVGGAITEEVEEGVAVGGGPFEGGACAAEIRPGGGVPGLTAEHDLVAPGQGVGPVGGPGIPGLQSAPGEGGG